MKPASPFKSLFYTGITICFTPLLIIVLMGMFGNSSAKPKSKTEVTVVDSIVPKVSNPTPAATFDTVKPAVVKPKKKKIETTDTVKLKEIKLDTTTLKSDSI
jgi:hypothetical protein